MHVLEVAMFVIRVVTGFIGLTIIASIAYGDERVILTPRVPADQLSIVKTIMNPVSPTRANYANGKMIFEGKGKCILCHGIHGDGKGPLGSAPDASPRNFHNGDWQKARTDGELKWVIANGVQGSWMHAKNAILTDEEIWQVVLHIRSFGR